MSDVKAEIKEPSYRILSDWVVDWVIANQPKDRQVIPREDVEALTGLKWGERDLMLSVLVRAKKKLYTTTRYEWSVTPEGLYMLAPSERVKELFRRQREALERHRATLASSATIEHEKLTGDEKSDLEHARRMALHNYEQGKRAMRNKWLPTAPPTQIP